LLTDDVPNAEELTALAEILILFVPAAPAAADEPPTEAVPLLPVQEASAKTIKISTVPATAVIDVFFRIENCTLLYYYNLSIPHKVWTLLVN
jgi:hypothetical protein